MNTELDKIGKRMPYTVPDDFFNQLEEEVLLEVHSEHKVRFMPMWLKSVAAVAAIVVMVAGGYWVVSERNQSAISEVEQAFANLTLEDQNYMLTVYQEDLFLNE